MDNLAKEENKNTKTKCVQSGSSKRDSDQIENNPGMFAAEQTWPTEAELKNKQRKMSLDEEN